MRIVIGQGSCGIAAGAEKVRKALYNNLTRLVKVSENDAAAIASFVESGDVKAVENLVVTEEDSEFLSKQTRIALRNCGVINPEQIDAYTNAGGYTALKSRAEAAQVSRHGSSGTPHVRARATRNTSSVTPTRAIPARSWTER